MRQFEWQESSTAKQTQTIEEKAQQVLDTRAAFPTSSLADLYDPLTMPPALVKAHNELDRAVDRAYRPQPFTSEAMRMVFLFELYEKYTAGLFTEIKRKPENGMQLNPKKICDIIFVIFLSSFTKKFKKCFDRR